MMCDFKILFSSRIEREVSPTAILEGLEAMTTCCGRVNILVVLDEKGVSYGLTEHMRISEQQFVNRYSRMKKIKATYRAYQAGCR